MIHGFLKWWYPKTMGFKYLNGLMTWMIWGTPISGTPHIYMIVYKVLLNHGFQMFPGGV